MKVEGLQKQVGGGGATREGGKQASAATPPKSKKLSAWVEYLAAWNNTTLSDVITPLKKLCWILQYH